MAKTWQDIVTEARVLLQDTDSDAYRWSNTVLLAKLNRALQELARLRPDAFWDRFEEDDIVVPQIYDTDPNPDSDTTVFDPDEDADEPLSASIDIPMQFFTPLVYFITASAELTEDEFVTDGRAITLMNEFKRMVLSL
jgi:hypothetical protein